MHSFHVFSCVLVTHVCEYRQNLPGALKQLLTRKFSEQRLNRNSALLLSVNLRLR